MSPEEVEQVMNGTYPGSYGGGVDENGVVTFYKIVQSEEGKEPNPRYIKEPMNSILQGVDATLPSGQINEYVACLTDNAYDYETASDYPRIKTFPLYSLLLIAVLSGAGTLLFRKKELR